LRDFKIADLGLLEGYKKGGTQMRSALFISFRNYMNGD
jgi:hypothetical protein